MNKLKLYSNPQRNVLKIMAAIIMMTLTFFALSSPGGLFSKKTVAKAKSAVELNREKSDYVSLNNLIMSNDPLVWTFNGSSTTSNSGNYSGNTRNYIEVLSSFLATIYGRTNDRMHNIAVGGYTVNDFSYNEPNGAGSFNPDIAYISIGKNDAAKFMSSDGSYYHSGSTPPQSMQNPNLLYFKGKVETFIDQARADGALVILGIPNGMEQSYGAQREYYENFFAPVLREIAEQKQVIHVDFSARYLADIYAADTYWFKADRMHVNGLGYLVLANTLIADLDLDKENSLYSTLDYTTQMAKKNAPYYTPLSLIEDTYIKESDTQKLSQAQYASYQRNDLSSLMSSNAVLFMGGDATAGVMSESVIERSFYQYFYRNCANPSSWTISGNIASLATKASSFPDYSVVFYMPEIYNSLGQVVETSTTVFESSLNSLSDVLASDKNCRLVLMTPFPQKDSAKNAVLGQYAQVINSFAQNKGLAVIDLYGYGNALSNKNESLIRNWTEQSGLPNYVAHLEIAKYIAKFLSRTEESITSAGGQTLVFTNPSATSGQELDNLTPGYSLLSGSTDTSMFMVGEIESIYNNDRIVYSQIAGNKNTSVYSKDSYVTIEHSSTGVYTFRAYVVRGAKTIFFNDVTYQITQIDEVQNAPKYNIHTNMDGADYSNIYYRNKTEQSEWTLVNSQNIVEIHNNIKAVELTPANSGLVGIKYTFAAGALAQNYNRITFTLSTEDVGYYSYRIWYYKDDGDYVEMTDSSGVRVYLSGTASTFYYDISSIKPIYPDITGFSVQLTNSSNSVLLHNVGVIEMPVLEG